MTNRASQLCGSLGPESWEEEEDLLAVSTSYCVANDCGLSAGGCRLL